MTHVVARVFQQQLEAALCTLQHCIVACPEELWQRPVARYPFSQVVFHTLFFADYYLGPSADSFETQPFHQAHPELFGDYEQLQDREPTARYEKEPLKTYLAFCRNKATTVLARETDDTLAAPCGFARRNFSRAELYAYTLRHIQHHAAQLILRLRIDAAIDIPWIGAGWSDPPAA